MNVLLSRDETVVKADFYIDIRYKNYAKPMEDLDDNTSSTGFEPLFIKEEESDPDRILMEQRECNTAQPGLTFTGTMLNQTALIKPYLQEMDDILKNCEELTGITFESDFSAGYNETSLKESSHSLRKEEEAMESCGERSGSPHAYLSTSYIDTHMDGAGSEDQQVPGQAQSLGTITNRCEMTTDAARQREMPLTSAGNKLSDTMVEYEGQLLGMLAMLESCMEEAGMDFEPQDWVADESQEYVHISKNPNLSRGTTLVPIQQVKPMRSETQPMQVESWADRHERGEEVSKESRSEVTVGPTTSGSQQNPMLSCDNMDGFLMDGLENQRNSKTDRMVLGPQFRFSEPSLPLANKENDPLHLEATKTGYASTNEGTNINKDVIGIEVDNTELQSEEGQEPDMDSIDPGSGVNDLAALGSQMEKCIEEVQRLEKRREELLAEVLELRGNKNKDEAAGSNQEEPTDSKVAELMNALKREEEERREERKREIQSLREERAEEERRMWKVNLERQGLQEELRKLKRRLFAMARDCAHNQLALNTQHREVELLKREEVRYPLKKKKKITFIVFLRKQPSKNIFHPILQEKLQSLVLQLTEESSQLRTAQQQQLLDQQAELHAQSSNQSCNTQDELTECRRHSCGDIQQYLQCGLKALEDRYSYCLLLAWPDSESCLLGHHNIFFNFLIVYGCFGQV